MSELYPFHKLLPLDTCNGQCSLSVKYGIGQDMYYRTSPSMEMKCLLCAIQQNYTMNCGPIKRRLRYMTTAALFSDPGNI